MARQFFSGNTIEQAVLSAASHFGLEPEEVAYKVREKKHGFIKTRRRIVIEVDPTAPRKEVESRQEEIEATVGESIAVLEALGKKGRSDTGSAVDSKTTETPEARVADTHDEVPSDEDWDEDDDGEEEEDDVAEEEDWDEEEEEEDRGDDGGEDWEEDDEEWDDDEEIAAFEKAIDRLIDFLDIDLEYDIERRDDLFEIELSGADAEVVTAEDGKVLEAIEHLLPRLVRGYVGHGLPCKVDCDGFRADRQQDLLDLADEAAAAVREAGRGLMLEPMNPADRRVIHLALADDPTVVTESEGDGYMKRVRVLPSEEGGDEPDDFVEDDPSEEGLDHEPEVEDSEETEELQQDEESEAMDDFQDEEESRDEEGSQDDADPQEDAFDVEDEGVEADLEDASEEDGNDEAEGESHEVEEPSRDSDGEEADSEEADSEEDAAEEGGDRSPFDDGNRYPSY